MGAGNQADAKDSGKADFRRIDPREARREEFPARIAGEFRVHFRREAYARMKAHAATTDEVELCGVLVGQVCQDNQGFFLEIAGAIEGKGANNYGSQVTFTHETWSHINEVKDRDFADQRIVGWYHTHPGFGVFLSGMDMFIQENFFSHPYQVAVLLETKQNVEGCFAWTDGKCAPLRRYWVGEEEVPLVAGEAEAFDGGAPARAAPAQERRAPEERAAAAPAASLGPPWLTPLMFCVVFFLGGVVLDRFLVASNMQQILQQTMESEVYSTLENASLGAMATQDFKDIKGRLQTIRESLPKDQPGAANLQEVETLLASLEQQYGKKRTAMRQDLQELVLRKQSLSDRVATVQRNQQELAGIVVNLYLLRLMDILKGYDATTLAKLSDGDRKALKAFLDRTIQLYPDSKYDIQKTFPGLIEYFYPPAATQDAAGPKGQ